MEILTTDLKDERSFLLSLFVLPQKVTKKGKRNNPSPPGPSPARNFASPRSAVSVFNLLKVLSFCLRLLAIGGVGLRGERKNHPHLNKTGMIGEKVNY
jgi:hypothetical protein